MPLSGLWRRWGEENIKKIPLYREEFLAYYAYRITARLCAMVREQADWRMYSCETGSNNLPFVTRLTNGKHGKLISIKKDIMSVVGSRQCIKVHVQIDQAMRWY